MVQYIKKSELSQCRELNSGPFLTKKRSTTELHRLVIFLSGRPGSNRRHSAWKADALPTELLPHYCVGRQDSNLRVKPTDLQSVSLAAWVSPQIKYFKELSRWRTRTHDSDTNQLPSQLSYISFFFKKARFKRIANVNIYFFNQNKIYFFNQKS